eukprot:CAMPEP_0176103012 /NCGR_PEP_ID=MMETSP0120_2-20121206/51679_1 /TAXON_ID=160619 /ORGANISM="Kryptoperidinium foliaceum, Strain CCMP 1326" /LENGTH=285 /DNA_ID=CAMNT_0017437091 /DNA_START=85 /DNA_END=939 /DNA_ORIENTATION=-
MNDDMTTETSSLLRGGGVGRVSSPHDDDCIPPSTQRSALFLSGLSAFLVLMLWNFQPEYKRHQHMDRENFDQTFHAWESDMYQRSQLIEPELLGRSKTSPKDKELVYFNHSKAFDMLVSTKKSLSNDFYYYQQGWDAQINQAYCAVASSMAAMNSLRGKLLLPQDPAYVPYPWATQPSLIQNECVRDNLYDVDKMEHLFWGLGLGMATILLNCNLQGLGFEATAHAVDPNTASIDKIRSIFKAALKDEDTRLLINYDRGGITQGPMGHGHFSPIGAYNEEEDAFL